MKQKKVRNFDQIRNRISITDVIGSFIKLTRKGNNSVGLCPFHDDKHASLSVSETKKIYKCFSCGNSGDVFTFVKNFTHCNYQEAVVKTCEIANINLDEFSDVKTFIDNKNKHRNLFEINKLANKYFMMFLDNKDNEHARQYLASRAIDDDLIARFDIGYAPNSEIVLDLINNKDDIVKGAIGYTYDEMTKAGLAVVNQEGSNSCYFKDRVTFAIRNEYDEIVGFSGRTLGTSNSKYINTPTTDIFLKNETLYNFNHVLKQYDTESIYVLEGFMDVIALHKIGIENAVATMGVAFSHNHINVLKKLPNLKSVILCFDNDEAGQNSIEKTAEIIKQHYDVYVVQYDSEFKDIDEIYMHNKDEAIRNANNIISYNLFMINKIIATHNFANVVEKKNALTKIVTILNSYKDQLELMTDIDYVAHKIGISAELLKEAVNNSTNKKSHNKKPVNVKKFEVTQIDLSNNKSSKNPGMSPNEMIEEQIVLFSLASARYLEKFFDECTRAELDETNIILGLLEDYYRANPDHPSIDMSNVYDLTTDDKILGKLVNKYLKVLNATKAPFNDKKVDAIIASFMAKRKGDMITRNLSMFSNETNPETRQKLLVDLIDNINKNNKK